MIQLLGYILTLERGGNRSANQLLYGEDVRDILRNFQEIQSRYSIYFRTVSFLGLLSLLLNWFELVLGRAASTVCLISAQTRYEGNQMYQS